MPDLSSFTQGTSNIAASDFLIGYVSAAGPGSERRWTAQDLTTGLLSLAGATPNELAHLSGTTGNIQSQINVVQSDVNAHEARVDNPHTVTATQVGLGSVDNTSDTDKPVSTLQASAIGAVQSDVNAHEARVDNPHTVTATQVGLGNVDNTSDTDKPVSTLQQAAIDAAGGGAFDADANTQITPLTPIVLDQATGDEAALTLDYTTNKATSGDDTGLLIDFTDTASPGTSKLMDLQVGGASKFSVTSGGQVHLGGGVHARIESPAHGYHVRLYGGAVSRLYDLEIYRALKIGGLSGYTTQLYADAANTLDQRNGVNAQTFNIYNTYTDATNYERAHIGWNDAADTFVIGTEAAGTGGVDRKIRIQGTGSGGSAVIEMAPGSAGTRWIFNNNGGELYPNTDNAHDIGLSSRRVKDIYAAGTTHIDQGTLTDDAQALNITSTWNDAADTFTLVKADVTNTASAADSKLLDLQVGGASKFSVDATGGVVLPNLPTADPLNAGELWNDSGALKVSAG